MREAAQQVLDYDLNPAQALEVIQGGSNLESQMDNLSNGNNTTAEQLIKVFRHCYYRSDRAPLTLFSGMAEVLSSLQNSDMQLAVVTSRYRVGANGEPTYGVLWELQRMELEGPIRSYCGI
jgi:phosphoglycolate phosphatase-like HAD superfamily hydrolase